MVKAEKVLVQKSGYMARSARANKEDLALIKKMCAEAAKRLTLSISGSATC